MVDLVQKDSKHGSFMRKAWEMITVIKNSIGNLLFIALTILLVLAFVGTDSHKIPDSAVMVIDPHGTIVEQLQATDPIEEFIRDENVQSSETLGRDLIDAINIARTDLRIKAISLNLSKLKGATLNQYDDIGKAL